MGVPVNLFDFSRGIVNRNVNPLDYPQNAVRDGCNVDLRDKGLKTRKGWTEVGTVVPAAGAEWTETGNMLNTPFPGGDDLHGYTLTYDSDRDRLIVYGGIADVVFQPDIWLYDFGTQQWSSVPVAGAPLRRQNHAAVYDTVTQQLFIFMGNGDSDQAGPDTLDDVWAWDPDTDTWTQKTSHPDGVLRWHRAIYRQGVAYIFGGCGADANSPTNRFVKYNCSTDTWTTISAEAPLSELPHHLKQHSMVYDAADDVIWLTHGHYPGATYSFSGLQRYSFATGIWTDIIPWSFYQTSQGAAVWHPGIDKIYVFGGENYDETPGDSWAGIDPTVDLPQWTTHNCTGNFWVIDGAAVYAHGQIYLISQIGQFVTTGIVLQLEFLEGAVPSLPNAPITRIEQVRFPTHMSSYILAQAENGSASELYVSDSELPSVTASFTKIKDLASGSNPLSIAVLNDRCILADQHNNVQVFAGCRSATGADWAVPKQVFATENGTDYYDLGTAALCDSDDDTTSELGSWPTAGSVLINCDMKIVAGFYIKVATPNANAAVLTVERYVNGTWTAVSATDGTAAAGASLAQTGVITWTAVSSDYQTIAEVPGFWWRLRWSAQLSAGTELTRVLYKAGVQDLQNIAANTGDKPIGTLYYDASDKSTKDYSVEATDSDENTVARLCRSDNSQAMGAGDYIYLGYYTPFMPIELTPGKDTNNSTAATMDVSYWNGTAWTAVSNLSDGTAVSGATLSQKGKVTFTLPTAWKENRPISRNYPQAYWVRIGVSGTLANPKATSLVAISEARVYSIPLALKKYKFAVVLKDRLHLISRSDAPDQCSMSRAFEEYGFSGDQSKELRIGGMDIIIAALQLYNQDWIAKADDWMMLNGMTPDTWAAERAETGHQVPLNNQCLCPAHIMEADGKAKMGVYFLNMTAVWHYTGLQVYRITDEVSWFDEHSDNPRLDKDYLHKACGVYWPDRNWLVWSVPMLFDDAVSQTTNNAVLVYDLTLQAWLPPMTFAGIGIASLCVAFSYSSTAASRLGGRLLLAGTYDGRVVRLFDGDDDNGTEIASWVETGHLHFGEPNTTKKIPSVFAYGKTAGNGLTVEAYVDGSNDVTDTKFFQKIASIGSKPFAQDFDKRRIEGNFIKLRLSWTGPSDIYGVQLNIEGLRRELKT